MCRNSLVKGGHKRIRKPAFELKTDGDGMPLLLDTTKMKLEEKKAISSIVTMPEHLLNAWTQAVVPWSAIAQSQDDFVETGKGPIFLFKAWKNKDRDMVASVMSRNLPSQQTHKVRKQMTQKPQNLSTKTESDLESDSHHMEDSNAEEDVVMEGENTLLAPKNMWGKKAVIVPSARTTQKLGLGKAQRELTFGV
ncbi:hypothetical protein EV702DRAFT_1049037 [Suillus placidus]|uniref:Uncharacterized protein n=1 Tax=Suillus placidus TaxID=48579 RepID=A0A9P6ZLD6_9AGAM|nr:hypothetical protein EV702DRAFT_1049037 [Suillus placidus]